MSELQHSLLPYNTVFLVKEQIRQYIHQYFIFCIGKRQGRDENNKHNHQASRNGQGNNINSTIYRTTQCHKNNGGKRGTHGSTGVTQSFSIAVKVLRCEALKTVPQLI
jgi:hypothetical protein